MKQDALSGVGKHALATARSNALLYAKALSQINTNLRKPPRTVEEPGRFYAGRVLLRVTALFAKAPAHCAFLLPLFSLSLRSSIDW